jgi:HK97 family phage major capsid protein
MKTLAQLRAHLATLLSQGTAKVAEFKALQARIGTLEGNALAEAQAQADALEATIDQLATEVGTVKESITVEERRASRAAIFGAAHITPPGTRPAATAADPHEGGTAGFRSMADFALSVRSVALGNAPDPRLLATTLPAGVMRNSGAAGEGFLVPPDFRDAIWEIVSDPDDIVNRTDTSPTESNSVGILKDESTPWGSAGIVAAWRAEGARMDPSKFATKGAQTPLHELYVYTVASDELLQDAPLLASRLSIKAGQAIAWKAAEALIAGDGVGKPLGYTKSPAFLVVPAETGQAPGTIVAENVAKMYARLMPSAIGGSVWLANSEVLPQLMTMKIGVQPIWTAPNAGYANAPGGFLLGRPVQFSEHCEALGAVGDLTLVNLKGYASFTKSSGITFANSIHLYFDMGLQAFRWTFRIGGQPYLSAPVKPAKGGATKSHFVGLAAR